MFSSIEPFGSQRAINGLPARNFKNRRRDSVRSADVCIDHLLGERSKLFVVQLSGLASSRNFAFLPLRGLCVFARNLSITSLRTWRLVSRKDAKFRKGAKFREDHLKGLPISQRDPRVVDPGSDGATV